MQQQVVLAVPPPLRVVIYRRLMLRIAERIARHAPRAGAGHRRRGRPGGVADAREPDDDRRASSTLPVLRPLVGMDKEEITAEAQRLGTYPISIIPDQDCCTLFTPRHPATKAQAARGRARRGRAADRGDGGAGGRGGGDRALPIPRCSRYKMSGFRRVAGADNVKITPGKLAGMKAVSDERGVIAAAAMDQRGSLQKALAKEKRRRASATARSRSSRSSSPKC